MKVSEVGRHSQRSRVFIPDNTQSAKPSGSTAQTEAEKKAERQKKLEAWKKKMAEDKERKEQELGAGGTRKLLDQIDQKAAAPPAVESPASPATPASLEAPTPYAGKFDPKAIAKKAGASSGSATTLGKDLPLKELTKASATITSVKGLQADKKITALNSTSKGKITCDNC